MTETMTMKTDNGNYQVTFKGETFYARPIETPAGAFILQYSDLDQDEFQLLYAFIGRDAAMYGSVGPNGVVARRGEQVGELPELRSTDQSVIDAYEKKYGAPGSKTYEQFRKEEEEDNG